MDENERIFSYKKYWGPEELKSRIDFSRNGNHYCIYCGKESETREHCPSKVFLAKPYPDNLPTLPACSSCNNSYSSDELYTEVYIDSLKYHARMSNSLTNNKYKDSNTAFYDAKTDLEYYNKFGVFKRNDRINRILTKLAICHMVYDLTEGYSVDGCSIIPSEISCKFSFEMTNTEISDFNCLLDMSNKILPILGSRVYDRIYVIEPVLESFITINSNEENKIISAPVIVMGWYDVQAENYRYISWLENDGTFHIRMIIHNFLYSEVIFYQS